MTVVRQLFILVLAFALFSDAQAQFTLIPDADFEQALIDLSLDDVPDGQVLTENIATVETLNVDDLGISDLTGIQAFDSLSHLSCKQNSLSFLDVSQNSNLIILDCRLNLLTEVDVTQNTLLLTLRCADNSISEIDLSQNPLLGTLSCSNNSLTGLDLSQNPDINWFICENAGLTSLELSQNTVMTILRCSGNNLTTLDLSQNLNLHSLECNDNQLISIDFGANASMSIILCDNNLLTELETGNMIVLEVLSYSGNQIAQIDLVSNCLQAVSCDDNQMEFLDMSLSSSMSALHCSNNPPLEWIDLRNSPISTVSPVVALNDPNLTCIYVDDATYDHGPNWQFDTLTTVIVETEAECMMPLGNLEYLQGEGSVIFPNPSYGHFSIETKHQLIGLRIYDLRGQELQSFPHQKLYTIELPKGIYLLRLEYEKTYEIKRLFVQ